MMTENKNNISDTFFNRYFAKNAENEFGINLLKFMWFKEGAFLHPQKKEAYLKNFIKNEIQNFYEKNLFNIPFLEFCITTKCSLKCKDCCALIPTFNEHGHIDMALEEYKKYLDKLCTSVDRIRHFVILGGEPLIHKELPKMIEYTAQKENIDFIRITTNGTILPTRELLEMVKKYNNRVYFFISNYSGNNELHPILKCKELKEVLKENNIRFQMTEDWNWLSELGMAKEKFAKDETKEKFDNCFRTKCTQVFDGKLDICSKALTARKLGLNSTEDYIDLNNTKNLRQELISFYQKEFQESCEYCIISDKTVTPALQ